jgi:peroxiredoxin
MRKIYASICILALLSVAAVVSKTLGDDSSGAGVAIGAKAPNFTLTDDNGKDVSLTDFSGKIVVLEWTNPNCPFVKGVYKQKIMQTLADQYQPKNVTWLAIDSTASSTNAIDKQWAADQSIGFPILSDTKTSVAQAYHATNTPEMFIIGTDGTLLYKGAITNDPDGDKASGATNYVQQALDEILSGKPVSQPETKPWGCGVHYHD